MPNNKDPKHQARKAERRNATAYKNQVALIDGNPASQLTKDEIQAAKIAAASAKGPAAYAPVEDDRYADKQDLEIHAAMEAEKGVGQVQYSSVRDPEGHTVRTWSERHGSSPVPDYEVPPSLAAEIDTASALDADDRFTSMIKPKPYRGKTQTPDENNPVYEQDDREGDLQASQEAGAQRVRSLAFRDDEGSRGR